MRRYCIFLTVIYSMFLGGCSGATESEALQSTVGEVVETIVVDMENNEEASESSTAETSISEDSVLEKEDLPTDVNWISEEKVKELRLAYYDTETLTRKMIDDAIGQADTEYCKYRSDSKLCSYVATNGRYQTGITSLVADNTVLSFEDIWRDEVKVFEVLKPYLLENTIAQVQNNNAPLVTNYEQIICNMDEHLEQWYWHMDATGVVITFRKQFMRSAEFEYKLLYSEWKQYFKEEYLFDTVDLIVQVDDNCSVELGDGKFVEIVDAPDKRNDVLIKTESMEIELGEMYGDYINAYLLSNGENSYYLLLETSSMEVYEYGCVLVFGVENGEITQMDSLQRTGIKSVDDLGNITLYILGEGRDGFDYSWKEECYRLEDGKLLPAV